MELCRCADDDLEVVLTLLARTEAHPRVHRALKEALRVDADISDEEMLASVRALAGRPTGDSAFYEVRPQPKASAASRRLFHPEQGNNPLHGLSKSHAGLLWALVTGLGLTRRRSSSECKQES